MWPRTTHEVLFLVTLLGVSACGEPAVITVPETQLCPPNATRCNGNRLEICSEDGSAIGTLNCPLGCAENRCITAECPPGSKACVEAKVAEHCDADGGSTIISCDVGCLNGECVDRDCAPGLAFCDPSGDKVQRCSLDGLSITVEAECEFGCNAADATCLAAACDTGDTRCGADGNPEVCNDERTAYVPVEGVECTEGCVDGECFVSDCSPGEKRCAVGQVEECNSAGTGFGLAAECIYGCISDGQGDALCAKCIPGTVRCDEQDQQQCANPLVGWQTYATCDELESCIQGSCVPVLNLDGSPTSDSLRILLTSALADCWIDMKQGPKDGPVTICRGLDTTGMSGDLSKSALADWFCGNQGDALTADDFSSDDHFTAAKNIYGCGILDLDDLTIATTSQAVHAGLFQGECIAHHADKEEIVVAPCIDLN